MKNTRDAKKEQESYLLTSFLKHAAIPALIVDAPEAPDFIIEHNGKRIGVELTETFIEISGGSLSLHAQENMANRIVGKAYDIYMQDRSETRVNVQVVFYPGRISPQLRLVEAACQLAQLVKDHPAGPDERIELRSEDFYEELPESVAYVRIYGLPVPELKERWTVAGAGWVTPLTRQHIEERIAAKSKRLPKYRNVIAENWLVIATKGGSPSQFFDRDSIRALGRFESPFERTYFFEHLSGTVVTLSANAVL